jgi:hypothetical protein
LRIRRLNGDRPSSRWRLDVLRTHTFRPRVSRIGRLRRRHCTFGCADIGFAGNESRLSSYLIPNECCN